MNLPVLTDNDDYPTLKLFVQEGGYSYKNSHDFVATDLRGTPARINVDILNGWYNAKIKLLLRNEQDSMYFDAFYKAKFDGKEGGIQRVMPFFVLCDIDGVKDFHLVQITKADFSHGGFKWHTKSISLDVQVRPYDHNKVDPCYSPELIVDMINCGYTFDDIPKINNSATDGFNPINHW